MDGVAEFERWCASERSPTIVGIDASNVRTGIAVLGPELGLYSWYPWGTGSRWENHAAGSIAGGAVVVFVETPLMRSYRSSAGVSWAAGAAVEAFAARFDLHFLRARWWPAPLRTGTVYKVTPAQWRECYASLGLDWSGKTEAVDLAETLIAQKIPNHDVAEAVLIAYFGVLKWRKAYAKKIRSRKQKPPLRGAKIR